MLQSLLADNVCDTTLHLLYIVLSTMVIGLSVTLMLFIEGLGELLPCYNAAVNLLKTTVIT